MTVQVAIVEDQRPTREGLAALIAGTPGYAVAGAWGALAPALSELERRPPHVVLLDLGLPGLVGTESVERVRERCPELPILVLTVFADDEHVFAALCAGADGYLLKDTPPVRLLEAIRELLAGGAPMSPEIARRVLTTFQRLSPPPPPERALSPRELDLVRLLAAGHSYKTAARELGVSLDTVRFHVRNVYDKLHAHSKSEAVAKALRAGLLR